jgi:hypothetical protein
VQTEKFQMHPKQQKLVEILSAQTQNKDLLFFHVLVAYHFAKLASMMRTKIRIQGRGEIPVNLYAINLASSGSGKGHSMSIIEDEVVNLFREHFMGRTLHLAADMNIEKLAMKRATQHNKDLQEEIDKLNREYMEAGPMLFSFDSGTTAAVKQMRHKLQLANCGAMSMEIDEIGYNLSSNKEVLTSFLELFDLGKLKQKLVKNTKENIRTQQLYGSTPTNMLLFGTPTRLLNGSATENEFYELLDSGLARRCFFGISKKRFADNRQLKPEEVFQIFNDTAAHDFLADISNDLAVLAEPQNLHTTLDMPKDVAVQWLAYRLHCERLADQMSEHEELRRAELQHRYFKVAKLAGAYAFIDQSMQITEAHLQNAIALAEASGEAFESILTRDRPHVKLAAYICSIGREVTEADLVQDLAFFKGSDAARKTMLKLAMAYSFKNNMAIKKELVDEIEFYSGKYLPETDIENMILSYSQHQTNNYANKAVEFNKLHQLVTAKDYHWVNHYLRGNGIDPGGYRRDEFCKPEFNILVLDIDGGVSIQEVKNLFSDHTYLIHTTKRHTDLAHRFRFILPMSHILELPTQEYKDFMTNVIKSLPFEVDTQTTDRARKWETFPGNHWYNQGKLFDVLPFIPKTRKADENKRIYEAQANLRPLERWCINQAPTQGRNNILLRYALVLVDRGYDFASIQQHVMDLNSQLQSPLEEQEIQSTILTTVSRKLSQA